MTLNIQEKINKIFSDESIVNRSLIFSPKKIIPSKFYKNPNDNQLNFYIKKDNSMEISNNKNSSAKNKRNQI